MGNSRNACKLSPFPFWCVFVLFCLVLQAKVQQALQEYTKAGNHQMAATMQEK